MQQKIWEHKIETSEYNIIIKIREDNKVSVQDYPINRTVNINKDFFYLQDEEIKVFKKKYLNEIEKEELEDYFWDKLNNYPFMCDPLYRYETSPEDDLEIIYKHSRYYGIYSTEISDISTAILTYYDLDYAEFEVLKDEIILYNINDIFCNFLDLLETVIIVKGTNYEYNDGARTRYSGYTEKGEYYFITSKIDKNIPATLFIKKINKDGEIFKNIIESKRTIITWLQTFQPLNISNLKKLEKYLFK